MSQKHSSLLCHLGVLTQLATAQRAQRVHEPYALQQVTVLEAFTEDKWNKVKSGNRPNLCIAITETTFANAADRFEHDLRSEVVHTSRRWRSC